MEDQTLVPATPDLTHYQQQAELIEILKQRQPYPKIIIHDVNNALAKINNALWLMAHEGNTATPIFRTCREIVERELEKARQQLEEQTTE